MFYQKYLHLLFRMFYRFALSVYAAKSIVWLKGWLHYVQQTPLNRWIVISQILNL